MCFACFWAKLACPTASETIGQGDADVAEAAVDDGEIIASIEGHHGAIVEAESQGHIFEGETEAEGGCGTEKEAVVAVFGIIKTETATEAAPKLPRGKTRGPVGPLTDVPVVDGLTAETFIKIENAGCDVEEVFSIVMILIFKVDGGAAKVNTYGVRGALGLHGCQRSESNDKRQ